MGSEVSQNEGAIYIYFCRLENAFYNGINMFVKLLSLLDFKSKGRIFVFNWFGWSKFASKSVNGISKTSKMIKLYLRLTGNDLNWTWWVWFTPCDINYMLCY